MQNKKQLFKTKHRLLAALLSVIMLVGMIPVVGVSAVVVTDSITVTARCTAAGIEVDKPTGDGPGHYYCEILQTRDYAELVADNYLNSGYGIFIATTKYTLLQNEKTTITTYSPSAVQQNRPLVNGTYGVFIFYTTDDASSTVFGYTIIEYSKPGIDTWSELQAALSAGEAAKLSGNVTASDTDEALNVPNGVTANIDLNGFSIDRKLSSKKNNGSVIVNNGTLNISDSSVYNLGSIVGGNNNGNGGGIINKGTLTIDFVRIDNNKCSGNGGGIYNKADSVLTINQYSNICDNSAISSGGGVYNEGSLTMNGGHIHNNTANKSGGGVYVCNGGSFAFSGGYVELNISQLSGGGIANFGSVTLNGGNISQNKTNINGGGIFNDGSFTMLKGKIDYNDADDNGGGVYNSGICYLSGGTITKNDALKLGSGIYSTTNFSISGSPKVESNNKNNVYLDNCLIAVVSGFTGKISVSSVSTTYPQQIASGTGYYTVTQADAANIVSDNSDLATGLINGKVYLDLAKDKLEATDFIFTAPTALVYDGTAKAATVTANSDINAGAVTVKYRDSKGNVSTTAPKNAGTYTVLIDVLETDEYAASANLTDSSWTFTIKQAELIVSCEDVTINKGQAIPSLTVKLDGFVNTEDEEYIKDTCDISASVSGVVDTTDTEITSFNVVCSSDVPLVNYYLSPKSVKITINTVNIADSDYISSYDLTQWQTRAIQLAPANGYTAISKDGIGWTHMVDLFSQGINTQTIYLKKDDGTITEGKTISYKIDSTAPTDICVKYGSGEFNAISNATDFTKFIKSSDSVAVTATASDSLSGVAKCSFFASDTPITSFYGIASQDTLSLEPGSKKIVYVRAMNNAGLYSAYAAEGVVVYTDSTVSPTTASFNKEDGKQADVGITMALNGNTLKEIKNGSELLVKDTDYTVSGSTVTISKTYLAAQENGSVLLRFQFYPVGIINEDHLTCADATITVTDTTHVHDWGAGWSHDSINHWHPCSGCDEKKDLANHEWNNGVVTTPATAAKEGIFTYTCIICGATKTVLTDKLPPAVSDSGNIEYTLGSGLGLEISSNAAREDFIGITVDGNTVDPSNYTVSADKLTVTLKDEYLKTLGEGKHTINIISKSGSATAEFTVKASSIDHDKAVSWIVRLLNFLANLAFKVSFFLTKTFVKILNKA